MTTYTVPVQNALERQRQALQEEIDALTHRVAYVGGCWGISEIVRLARELGALDQVCAEHGITATVMTRTLG